MISYSITKPRVKRYKYGYFLYKNTNNYNNDSVLTDVSVAGGVSGIVSGWANKELLYKR